MARVLTGRQYPPFAEPSPTVPWAIFSPVRLVTSDHEQIGGWFAPGHPDRPVVLLLHGYRGSRTGFLEQAELAARHGCGTLLISLRAHGDSTGSRDDLGYSARRDVTAAVDWLHAQAPARPVIVFGTSLGAAAAIFAARDLDHQVAGYILECPYKDIWSAVQNRTDIFLPIGLSQIAYAGLVTVSPLVVPHAGKISPYDAITGVPSDVPLLFLAGGRDDRAKPDEVAAIYHRAGAHSRWVLFAAGTHSKLRPTEPALYDREFLGFIDARSRK